VSGKFTIGTQCMFGTTAMKHEQNTVEYLLS